MYSKLMSLMQASKRLPQVQREIYKAMFERDEPPEKIAVDLDLTPEQLKSETEAMARNLRGVVT